MPVGLIGRQKPPGAITQRLSFVQSAYRQSWRGVRRQRCQLLLALRSCLLQSPYRQKQSPQRGPSVVPAGVSIPRLKPPQAFFQFFLFPPPPPLSPQPPLCPLKTFPSV